MRSRRSMATVLIGQPLLDCEFRLGQAVGDTFARPAIAVEQVAPRFAAGHVRRNRVGNLPPIVPDVRDVLAALASELACADVDGGHTEIRALANRDARI